MYREQYERAVLARLIELLDACANLLPCRFSVSQCASLSDGTLKIVLDPIEPCPPSDCEGVFVQIAERIDKESKSDPCHVRVDLQVPYDFLNAKRYAAERSLAWMMDKAAHRSVPVKESHHG